MGRRVANQPHVIRKPVVDDGIPMMAADNGETARIDVGQIKQMLARYIEPLEHHELETDIEICAESSMTSTTRDTRLAHTVRRVPLATGSSPEIATLAIETASVPHRAETVVVEAVWGESEPNLADVLPRSRRNMLYAAAAVVGAAIALVLVVLM